MDIRKLEVFCKIIELGSFTRAAQAMQLAQPTVSDHLRTLEEELGQKLVDRLGREAQPTAPGQLLYSYATRILRLQQQAVQAIEHYSGEFVGNLVVGASTIPGTFILPKIISRFRQEYPDIKVSVQISGSRTIARDILDGEYDLGLVGAMWNERGLEWQPLFADTLVLVVQPGCPLARRRSLSLNDMLAEPFICREENSGTRKSIAQILERSGYKEADLHEVAQFGSNEAVKEAVKAGVGISMLSRRAVREDCERGALVAISLDDIPAKRSFSLVIRKNKALSPAASIFVERLRAEADQQDIPAV